MSRIALRSDDEICAVSPLKLKDPGTDTRPAFNTHTHTHTHTPHAQSINYPGANLFSHWGSWGRHSDQSLSAVRLSLVEEWRRETLRDV